MNEQKNNNPIASLLPVLDRWRHMIHSFSKADANDAAYWYSERANCGVLSAAAWLAGGRSLVAYGHEKTWEGESYAGRVDVWIETEDKENFIIEAKHDCIWTFRSVEELRERLTAKLSWACEDAARVRATADDRQLGVLFALPGPRKGDARAMDLFHKAREGFQGVDIHEWVESPVAPPWKSRIYPGVLLLGRFVSSSESENGLA